MEHPGDIAGSTPRAVLWDMDGTLLDSAEYHWLAWQTILAAERYDLTYEQFVATFGQRNDTILRDWLGADLPASEVVRIGGAKEARYRELVRERGVSLLPGVDRWLNRLKRDGWKQAIASAAPLLNIETILDVLGIAPFFDAVTSSEDVQRGKPDPQVYLVAAERVGAAPARCVVVEDAPAGIEGARRGGMRAIGVRSSHAGLEGDIVVDTLAELPDDAFDRLMGDAGRQRA
ncbi:MAG TPA: HAD family phosphatase [Roseiflexaceae bacterium]